MQPYHRRLAELWMIARQNKKFTTHETVEWVECLQSHMLWVSKLNRLENLASAASLIGDHEWEKWTS